MTYMKPAFMRGNLLVNPLLSLEEAESSFKELSGFVHEVGGTFTLKTMPSWYSFFTAHIGNEVFPGISDNPRYLTNPP